MKRAYRAKTKKMRAAAKTAALVSLGIPLAAVPALISKLHKYGTAAEPNANDLMHSEPTQQRCEADEPHSVDVGSPLAVE